MNITRADLRQSAKVNGIECLRRLAKANGLRRGIDSMSIRQLSNLIFWRLSRKAKRERGFIV